MGVHLHLHLHLDLHLDLDLDLHLHLHLQLLPGFPDPNDILWDCLGLSIASSSQKEGNNLGKPRGFAISLGFAHFPAGSAGNGILALLELPPSLLAKPERTPRIADTV